MATLTEISIATRKFFLWIIAFLVGYIILKNMVGVGISYWKTTHPIAIPPPDVLFGKLPSPVFSTDTLSSSGMNFTLLNVEGRPPETTAAAKVYLMPKKLPTLLSLERAKQFSTRLGFPQDPDSISSTNYHYIDPQDPKRTLTLDIINMNFTLKYDYLSNPNVIEGGKFTSKDQGISAIKSFIEKNNLFDETIINGKTVDALVSFNSTTKSFDKATSIGNADTIRVDFFRKDIDNLKVVSAKYYTSQSYALYTSSTNNKRQILELSYTFWPIAFDSFGTYPLRSSTAAWQDLIDGYAYVVNLGSNSPNKITIRNIFLAYYDSANPQQYFQPVFVFEGDNEFAAYVPAVSGEWLE